MSFETYSESFWAQADDNGTVPYSVALQFVREHSMEDQFLGDYGPEHAWQDPETGKPIGVDVGELLVWMGY